MVKRLIFAACAVAVIFGNAQAFDLKSLLGGGDNNTINNIVNAVIGSDNFEIKDLAGTWKYKNPAVAFESEDLLSKAGGVAAASTIESKIAPYYSKVGMEAMSITFTESGEFTLNLKKGSLKGTVTKGENGKYKFEFKAFGSIKAFTAEAYVKKGTTLEITFNVTKLMELVSNIAKISGNSTMSTLTTLLNNYKGLYAGFELAK